jgi:hypothetical protein
LEKIPFKFTVKVRDSAGKDLPGATVRLTVCVSDFDGGNDDVLKCSFVGLGKTNSLGNLTKTIYAEQIAANGTRPVWADKRLTRSEYWNNSYATQWRGYITVLKTNSTAYSEYSKTIKLYDSTSGG